MKKLALGLLTLAVISCKDKPKDYVTLSGKIENKKSDKVLISGQAYKKTISLNENGTFKDTLKLKKGFYAFSDGNEQTFLFLQNGDEINITLDTKKFDESIVLTGKGSEESAILTKSLLERETIFNQKLEDLSETDFNKLVKNYMDNYNNKLTNQELDSSFVLSFKEMLQGFAPEAKYNYDMAKYFKEKLAKGMEAPAFENFENINGKTSSLSDFKGKYVYIDCWATWCRPCREEIPHFKKLVEKYKGKNIAFIGISVGDANKESWKTMVTKKEMIGVQLFSARNKAFSDAYKITGIPRFILIDPQGKIINAVAPRPSQKELTDLLDSLL